MRLKLIAALLAFCAMAAAQDAAIDVQRSTITIHVGKAGFFGRRPRSYDRRAHLLRHHPGIRRSARRVHRRNRENDRDAGPQGRRERPRQTIQKDMEEMTLETKKFPQITFRSSRISKLADGWKVEGDLSLHGVTKPVSLAVKKSGNSYTAHTALKQTTFGIKPISIGGLIKVKDEVELDFTIFPRQP